MKTKELTKDEIINKLKKHKKELKAYGVKRIGLFGSFAKDDGKKKSDIDFFVEFEDPSFDNFMGLSYFLEHLFGRKIEILTPAGVESIRIKHIKEEIQRSIVYV